jgi:glyoxylate/hydroxypyruvate reductase A
MSLLIMMPDRDPSQVVDALHAGDPGIEVRIWPDTGDPEAIEMVVAWQHPPGALNLLPRLGLIMSYGAGVDHLLRDPDLPSGVRLARLVDPQLVTDMVEYVVGAVVAWRRGWARYREQQQQACWQPHPYRRSCSVLVLGMGQLGGAVAAALSSLGLTVTGWSRAPAEVAGVVSVTGRDGLDAALPAADVVICLLPLTRSTEGILDRRLLARMRPGSLLLNLGRGRHLVEPDLLEALASGRPAAAWLDVFTDEPLPPDHPFWHHPQITVTPHVASLTNPASAAQCIITEYRRLQRGEPPLHPVDQDCGY